MSSIIKVDTVQDTDANNIINENSNTITIGASGDTIPIPYVYFTVMPAYVWLS